MTSPRSTYGGGYYAAPSFADTPIYDSLVAERGTPQIAPIRVPSAYDTGSQLPALPAALPALPAGPSHHTPPRGYPAAMPQSAPLQQAPAPYIPQQAPAPRGYGYPAPHQQQPPQMRPVAPQAAPPRQMPGPTPGTYDDPYGRQHPYPGY
ncbi:DUF6643 family protein [Streptomyces gobiensis]|uniref:DUF6643 family protein n=1 Tax=Streptomyces gobiensis TaxID=2875706 RepID=UPI001E5CD687|nr:DUF6643 family protein [Streptomyces gobiensis]UGY94733.1 hypothetical protein test1122_25365 [Streptomyces gobiensis]